MRFHHVGILVANIEEHFKNHFAAELGMESLDGPVFDPSQKAFTAMIRTGPGAGIELISPNGPDSPIASAFKNGGGMHHICYEVDDIEATLEEMRSAGMVPVSPPTPATLFDGLRVAFMYSKLGGLVELVESKTTDPESGRS
jgi:methylmalonyl-CoA/ethylmalonyl-CoA epimerase